MNDRIETFQTLNPANFPREKYRNSKAFANYFRWRIIVSLKRKAEVFELLMAQVWKSTKGFKSA